MQSASFSAVIGGKLVPVGKQTLVMFVVVT
jgi:hypothetical protein